MAEETAEPEQPAFTRESVGKGLAFLGMTIFVASVLFFLMSIAQPANFSLFSGPQHLFVAGIVSLILVIGGYFITRFVPEEMENGE